MRGGYACRWNTVMTTKPNGRKIIDLTQTYLPAASMIAVIIGVVAVMGAFGDMNSKLELLTGATSRNAEAIAVLSEAQGGSFEARLRALEEKAVIVEHSRFTTIDGMAMGARLDRVERSLARLTAQIAQLIVPGP